MYLCEGRVYTPVYILCKVSIAVNLNQDSALPDIHLISNHSVFGDLIIGKVQRLNIHGESRLAQHLAAGQERKPR